MTRMHAPECDRQIDHDREYLVKAAMLVKIHEHVTWPESADTPLGIFGRKRQVAVCVIGENPFPKAAQELFKLASTPDRKFAFTVSKTPPKWFCQIAFVADDRANDVDAVLARIGLKPTLTVSDIPGFAKRGGDIELFMYENRVVRLLINEQSALEKGLVYGRAMYNERIAQFVRKRH